MFPRLHPRISHLVSDSFQGEELHKYSSFRKEGHQGQDSGIKLKGAWTDLVMPCFSAKPGSAEMGTVQVVRFFWSKYLKASASKSK